MASPPAPDGCRGWLHIVVAWRDLPTPRLAGLALGKRMYLAGSCCPSSLQDLTHSLQDTRFRHSFSSCLPGWHLASVVQDAHSLIFIDWFYLFVSICHLAATS